MSNIGKIVGFFGGWLLARWEGALAGLFFGSIVDNFLGTSNSSRQTSGASYTGQVSDFNHTLLALSAAVMQSDGKTTRSELDYVRNFFLSQFGVEKTKENLLILRDLLKKDIHLETICMPVRLNMAYNGRVQLLHYLFGIAHADNDFSPREETVLNRIAQLLGITITDYRSVAAMFVPTSKDASFEILGIPFTATDEEIKKAYRRMALEFHPDRVSHLGEDVRRAAEEKFKKIQAAYEDIKKARGFA